MPLEPLAVNEPCGERSPDSVYGIREFEFDCVYPISGQYLTFQKMTLEGDPYWDMAEIEVYKPVAFKGETEMNHVMNNASSISLSYAPVIFLLFSLETDF